MNGSICSIFWVMSGNCCSAFSRLDLCVTLAVRVRSALVIHSCIGCFADRACIHVIVLSTFVCNCSHGGSKSDSISNAAVEVVQ
jgi:hypothetical protein